jgi:hypothetical protein
MSNINLDFVERSQPSLFIHFAYTNVTEEMVSRTLNELDLGTIKEISFKPSVNKKEEHGNSIAIHFDRWFRNPQADKVRQKMISGKSIDINYTPKSYWKVVAFQQKSKTETQPRVFKKPTITFDDDDEDDFGPKLGLDCSEKHNASKVRRDEQPRPKREQPRPKREQPKPKHEQPRPKREQPRPKDDEPQIKRPTTPTEAPPVVYKNYYIQPDAFDLNEDITNKGVMLPPPKRNREPEETNQVQPKRKPNIIVDDTDDEDSEDEEIKALYSDLK